MSIWAFALMVVCYIAAGVAVYIFMFLVKREDNE